MPLDWPPWAPVSPEWTAVHTQLLPPFPPGFSDPTWQPLLHPRPAPTPNLPRGQESSPGLCSGFSLGDNTDEIAGLFQCSPGKTDIYRLWASRSREVCGFHACVPTRGSSPHRKGTQLGPLAPPFPSPPRLGFHWLTEGGCSAPTWGLVGPSIRGPPIPLFLYCPLRTHSSS